MNDCRNCETGAHKYYCKDTMKRELYIHSDGSLNHDPENYTDNHGKSRNRPFKCEKWSEKK